MGKKIKMKNKTVIKIPIPLFDTIENIKKAKLQIISKPIFADNDFDATRIFLKEYDGNQATFNSYRREIERLLQWAWLIKKKSIFQLKRDDIEAYVNFCKNPPQAWIGIAKVPRFIEEDSKRKPNPTWRPFVATISKVATKQGKIPDVKQYALSEKAVREIFAILGSFYKFLIQENYTEINPVTQIRQKSKYFRKQQTKTVIRRLTELQWGTVIETAKQLADVNPKKHERTLFIMSILYSMYLRISELTASKRWLPKMNDFRRDHDGNWWFTTVGKGNKERQIAVSDSMLDTLKRWRKYLKLTPLPSVDDQTPLIPNTRNEGAISSTNQIRNIVQYCFDEAIKKLNEDGFTEEANGLQSATVHWLRHTGISDDIKRRPREHVRDDAGHSSSITTDKYIDVDLRERHSSAKKKLIDRDEIFIQKNEPSISNYSKLTNKKILLCSLFG
jgi:site-specific recombinase XerD